MTKGMAHRFLDPKSPRQRRYEALRARRPRRCPTEAARRFGYSHGSFRNLCSQFVNAEDPDFLSRDPARTAPVLGSAEELPVPGAGRGEGAGGRGRAGRTPAARPGAAPAGPVDP